MKLSAESYLKGPINAENITEVLCYNSKITGLIINQNNLSEVSGKILNLGITDDRSYIPTLLREDGQGIMYVEIEPNKHLAYAPSSGFDTLIYYVKPDEIRYRFAIGYSKLPNVVGNSTLTEVESIHYGTIRVNLTGLWKIEQHNLIPADLGDINTTISDPQQSYLSQYKKRKDLDFSVKVEAPVEVMNSNVYQILPFYINNQPIPNSTDLFWKENQKAPLWIGADSIRIQTSSYGYGEYLGIVTLKENRDPQKIRLLEMNIPPSFTTIDENYSPEDYFRDTLPKYISREFIVDENGGLWSCPRLVDISDDEHLSPLFDIGMELNFPIGNTSLLNQQPLLDISRGTLVSKESIFSSVSLAQYRVRDVVNTIIPLTLLFTDRGKIWIKLKIGAWFVFDLPQYKIEVVQNRTTAIVVPKENSCQFYPINDKSILVRTPKRLTLYNTPGEWCDEYTYNNVVTRFPHSKLLNRFKLGGVSVDETNIYKGPLNRYRKNILPKTKINIVGALNGIIVYYYESDDDKLYINYL